MSDRLIWVHHIHPQIREFGGAAAFTFRYSHPRTGYTETRVLHLNVAKGPDPYYLIDLVMKKFTQHIRESWVECVLEAGAQLLFAAVQGPVEEIAPQRAAAELTR